MNRGIRWLASVSTMSAALALLILVTHVVVGLPDNPFAYIYLGLFGTAVLGIGAVLALGPYNE